MKNRVTEEILDSFNAGGLDPIAFKPINTLGLIRPCCLIRIVNRAKHDVFISYDGVNEHDFIPHGEVLEVNIRTSVGHDEDAQFSKRTIVYVKGSVSIGYIHITGYTQED